MISLLRDHGFTQNERLYLLSQSRPLRELYLQLDVNYLVKQNKNETELRLYTPQKDHVILIKKRGRSIEAKLARVPFKTTTTRVQGRVEGSLMANILSKINSNWVASRFIDAYIMDYNLDRDLIRGAAFSFTVEKKYDGPFFIRYGEILQTSLNVRGRKVEKRFVKFQGGGGVFISENDLLLKKRPIYAPVDYLRIASLFQPRRRHPITRKIQPHMGVDFELPGGSSIYAARAGHVLRFGYDRAAGNYLVIKHTNGLETSYNHMNFLPQRLRLGLKIKAGEKIGEVGCTGYCTKAHLHFTVRQQGRLIDPLRLLRPYPIFAENLLHAKIAQF